MLLVIPPGQSDFFPYKVPKGIFNVDLHEFPRIIGGPINFIQLNSTDPNYMWAASTGTVNYVDISNGKWNSVAQINSPNTDLVDLEILDKALGRKITTVKEAEDIVQKELGIDCSRVMSNVYMFADKDNLLYSNSKGGTVNVYGLIDPADPAKGIKVFKNYNFSKILSELGQKIHNPSIKNMVQKFLVLGLLMMVI